jgi:hypothetical protein
MAALGADATIVYLALYLASHAEEARGSPSRGGISRVDVSRHDFGYPRFTRANAIDSAETSACDADVC